MPDYELLEELQRNESKQSLGTVNTIKNKSPEYKHLSKDMLLGAYKSLEISSDSSIGIDKYIEDDSFNAIDKRYKKRLNIDQAALTRDESITQIKTHCDKDQLVKLLNKMINMEAEKSRKAYVDQQITNKIYSLSKRKSRLDFFSPTMRANSHRR